MSAATHQSGPRACRTAPVRFGLRLTAPYGFFQVNATLIGNRFGRGREARDLLERLMALPPSV
jgi:hypothetical protein